MHNVATWLIPPQITISLVSGLTAVMISSSSISFERLDGVRAIIMILIHYHDVTQECHDVIYFFAL